MARGRRASALDRDAVLKVWCDAREMLKRHNELTEGLGDLPRMPSELWRRLRTISAELHMAQHAIAGPVVRRDRMLVLERRDDSAADAGRSQLSHAIFRLDGLLEVTEPRSRGAPKASKMEAALAERLASQLCVTRAVANRLVAMMTCKSDTAVDAKVEALRKRLKRGGQ